MEVPKIYYIVFTDCGEIEILNHLNRLFRNDIRFIIRRTFVKRSGGKRLHFYYRNEILDKTQNVVENNNFVWGGLNCELRSGEYYGKYQYFLDRTDLQSACLSIKVKDLLGKEGFLAFKTHHFNQSTKKYELNNQTTYITIKDDLDLLNNVGTYEGLIQIKRLHFRINKLKNK